jgi:putative PIN family toxin of toxin-antitoxin system
MRVSIDTNVFVSYFLKQRADRNPARAIQAAFDNHFELVLSETLLQELAATIESKPYLRSRVSEDELNLFIQRIRDSARITPEILGEIPSLTRDFTDDYIIVHSLLDNVDVLVTGDKDLLVLGRIDNLHIVTPAEFIFLLEQGEEE